ncbi:MAG: tripartite tricarboxylate transporter substrate binding protein [Burkholderiales bacterium]|nr:tripartite tricarboxylate transporter substrate binding protein [Burkholderiales bacterium]
MKTKSVLSMFAAAAALMVSMGVQAQAQAWPNKPIRLVIPFPPGNTTDIMARLMAPRMAERLGQPVIVENRPGASGMLGLDFVARSAPDGYTFAAGQGGNLAVLPHTSKSVPYDALKDFTPIAVSTANYLVVVGATNAPFKTLPEMIAWAKANPGKLTVASNGEGGFPHLIFEQLRMMAGFSFNHIPYKGSAQIATELMGGQVMAGVDGVTGLTPHIKSGRINLLAVTSKARTPQWPDAPAAAEAVPGYESGGWFGWVGPAGMPREIVARLNEEINRAMKHPDIVEKLSAAGLTMLYESPDFFAELIRSEHAKYGKLVKAIGFKPQ